MSTVNRALSHAILICLVILVSVGRSDSLSNSDESQWARDFDSCRDTFSSTGVNRYFKLLPNYQLVLEGVEDDDSVKLEITVLNETMEVDGIETRVVEERESANGELIEISRNFFAFCEDNSDIFYFGEDVDIYKEGEVVSHSGAWRAGQKDYRPGLMMPGVVLYLYGVSYYQEVAPEVAMDRARIVNTDTSYSTPAGAFEHCIIIEETSELEPDSREFKIYAPGIGLIRDGNLLLTSYGMIDE